MIEVHCCRYWGRRIYLIYILNILLIPVSKFSTNTEKNNGTNKGSGTNGNQNGPQWYYSWWTTCWVTKFVWKRVLIVLRMINILTAKWITWIITCYALISGAVLPVWSANEFWAFVEYIFTACIIVCHITVGFVWDIKSFLN